MINLEDINDFFRETLGDKVKITIPNEPENEKDQLKFIVEMLQSIVERDFKLAELINVEFTSYNEPFFIIIENLIALHYGDDVADMLMFYIYGNKDENGNDIPYNEDEEGNPIYIKTFDDLWNAINQQPSEK
jgi:hypothetical protein